MRMLCLSAVHIHKSIRAVMLVALALGAGSLFAEGQVFWQEGGVSVRDSTVGVVAGIVPDNSGGAIVVWGDDRRVPMTDAIYLQHIDSTGSRLWPDSGLAACQPVEGAYWLTSVPDGAGGLVMYWQVSDCRVRAQRVDGNGARPWGDSSLVVFDTTGLELRLLHLGMCSDGRHGCVVFWSLYYPDSIVLRAQYIDSLGQRAWGTRGRRIARDLAVYGSVGVVALGSQGFVFTWICDNDEICAQRVDAAGNEVWTAAVCSGVPVYGWPSLVRTGGGVFVCWTDMRNGDWDVYAQKLNAAGNPLWAQNGVPVCRAAGQQGGWVDFLGDMVHVTGLPDGGALVAFYDRSRGATSISCQRLSTDGDMMWDSTGVEAGRIMDKDTLLTGTAFGLVPDTTGGAIVTWPRYRPGDSSQIWAQHLCAAGTVCWDSGVCISDYAGYYDLLPALLTTTDARNGVIGCWGDFRFGGPNAGIYAQRYGDGPTGLAEAYVDLPPAVHRVCPSPARTVIEVRLPRPTRSLVIADALGRVVQELRVPPGALSATWNLRDVNGSRVPAGVYVFRQRESGMTLGRVVVLNP
jgi:hypothetical protein